jgi:hypothetical protein
MSDLRFLLLNFILFILGSVIFILSTLINCVLQIVYLFDIKSNQHIKKSTNQSINHQFKF